LAGRLRLTIIALVFGMVFCYVGAGVGIGLFGDLPSRSISHQPNNQGPVVFRNDMDGFEFEVPAGWVISTYYENGDTRILVDRETSSLEDGFELKRCLGRTSEDCMGDDGMAATLMKVTEIQMAGYPAKEYTYDRGTGSGTRLWKEVVSVLQVKDRTYAVIVQIPYPAVHDQSLAMYRQIRRSPII
jgi:hypothetical protein